MNSARKTSPRTTKGVLYFRNISPAVKSVFKGTVSRRGENMTAVVEALMELYVKDPTVVKIKRRK